MPRPLTDVDVRLFMFFRITRTAEKKYLCDFMYECVLYVCVVMAKALNDKKLFNKFMETVSFLFNQISSTQDQSTCDL